MNCTDFKRTSLRIFFVETWPHFYQTRSAWSVDQGSNKNHSPAYNFAPTVTKFCVMWEGLSLPHDTKFGNCRCKILDSTAFPSWSLIQGLRWSGLIKAEPGVADNNTPSILGCLLRIRQPGIHFTKGWWEHDWNLMKHLSDSIMNLLIQSHSKICIYHDSSFAVWCMKLSRDLVIISLARATWN